MAATAAWLAIPRPVMPGELLPMPSVDRARIARERAADRELAERARATPLPYAVRAVGELVRRYGVRQARGDATATARVFEDLARARRAAQAEHGAAPLAVLRAVQSELFLARVAALGRLASDDRELVELGGDLARRARRAGWADEHGRVRLAPDELWIVYRTRWTELAGALADRELGPRLEEVRAYYHVLLARPDAADTRERDERRLAYAAGLGARDPEYPAELARGVLLHRLGQPAFAAEAYLRHLEQRPDGPWALRARNHLLAALAESNPLE